MRPAILSAPSHVGLTLGLVVATFVLSSWTSSGRTEPPVLVAGIVVMSAAAVFPAMAGLLALVLANTALASEPFRFAVAGIQTDAAQVAVYSTVLGATAASVVGRKPAWPRATPPLLLLGLAACIGWLVGLTSGGSTYVALGQLKTYLMYLFGAALGAAFAGPDGRDRLETWVIRIALAGSLVALALSALDLTPNWEVLREARGSAAQVTTLGQVRIVRRFHPPVQPLAVLALLLVLSRNYSTWRRWSAAAVFIAVIGLGFDRSVWAPLLGAVAVVAWARRGSAHQPHSAIAKAVLAVALTSVTFTGAAAGILGPTAQGAAERLTSIVDPRVAREASAEERASEFGDAVRQVAESPLVGTGLGRPTGASDLVYVDNPPQLLRVPRYFLHNSFLMVWVQLGALGVFSFLWLWWIVGQDFLRAWRSGAYDRSRRLASALALGVLAVSSLAHAYVLERASVIAAGVCIALLSTAGSDAAERQ